MPKRVKRLRPFIKNLPGKLEHIKSEQIDSGDFRAANLYFMDESRFGLKAITRRALAPRGHRPIVPYQHRFQNFYLFGAYSPLNGHHFTLELPRCNGDMFQLWMEQFSQSLDEGVFAIVVLDNGAFHKRKDLVIPANIGLLFLPPYSPELNGAERIWDYAKRGCANRYFETLDALSNQVEIRMKTLTKERVASIVGSPTHTSIFNQIFGI